MINLVAMSLRKLKLIELFEEDYLRVPLLEGEGINYKHYLDKTLEQVCEEYALDADSIETKLSNFHPGPTGVSLNIAKANPDVIINYLEKTHHSFSKAKLPIIKKRIHKLHKEMGKTLPQVFILKKAFDEFMMSFLKHIHYESKVVFPFILELQKHLASEMFDAKEVMRLLNDQSLDFFMAKHDQDDDEMAVVKAVTKNFSYEDDDNLEYKVIMTELKYFEYDLKEHSHVEDNVLFEKALQAEKTLKTRLKQVIRFN